MMEPSKGICVFSEFRASEESYHLAFLVGSRGDLSFSDIFESDLKNSLDILRAGEVAIVECMAIV